MGKFKLTDEFVAELQETGAGVHDDNLWTLINELADEVQKLREENTRLHEFVRQVDDRSDLY